MRAQWILRTALVFVLMTAFLMLIGLLVGAVFGYALYGMAVMAAISLVVCFVSYWFSKQSALKAYRVRIVTEAEEPRLYRIVQKVAEAADLPMPEVGVAEMSMPNAFATGRGPKDAAVVATRGILDLLSDDELEAVFGHEMSHVKNRDILVMSVASMVASLLTFAARMIYYGALFGNFGRDRENGGALIAIGIVSAIFVPIAAVMMQLAVSRNREYLADETGARITRKPLQLASALRKLEGWSPRTQREARSVPNDTRSDMWISEPKTTGFIKSLFSTHPPTEKRIERLRRIAEKMGSEDVSDAFADVEHAGRSELQFRRSGSF